MADCSRNVIVRTWKKLVRTAYVGVMIIAVRAITLYPTGKIHSVLKLDSRHFGVVAASEYKSLGTLKHHYWCYINLHACIVAIAVYDINKSTMREKDHYELVFVRYLYNTHNEDICCLASVSSRCCIHTCTCT